LLVIGVAGTVKSTSLIDGLAGPYVYLPLAQQYEKGLTSELTIATRTAVDHSRTAEIKAIVAGLDPKVSIVRVQTLEDSVALGLLPQRVATILSSSLGLVALLLAAVGIHGVTAYTLTRRTREIGVRVALGAQRRDVTRLVLRHGASIAFIGCAIGLLMAAAVGHAVAAFLFGVSPMDLPIFIGTTFLFTLVTAAACYVPARRAIRINPLEAIRYE
jgi:ABC-type antimicrobial peptide transport system permease subunit